MSDRFRQAGIFDTAPFSQRDSRLLTFGEELMREADLPNDFMVNPGAIVDLANRLGIEATIETIPGIVNQAIALISGIDFYNTDY